MATSWLAVGLHTANRQANCSTLTASHIYFMANRKPMFFIVQNFYSMTFRLCLGLLVCE